MMSYFLRLLCLVVAVSVAAPADARWRYNANIDPFTDERASTAIKTNSGIFGASLIIRCKDGILESYYNSGHYLGNDDYTFVRYRFDKSEVETGGWSMSTDGKAAFSDTAVEFARNVVSGSTLVIEAEDFSGSRKGARFSLAGSAGPVGRVLSDCRLMAKDPRSINPDIWRRVVQSLDNSNIESAKLIGEFLDTFYEEKAPHKDRRRVAIYESLSKLYLTIVAACENQRDFAMNLPSCQRYIKARQSDADADYPIEAVPLLIEFVKTPSDQ